MKLYLRRNVGKPRLELHAENENERAILHRWVEMLNDNVSLQRASDRAFGTNLQIEMFDTNDKDLKVEIVAIETGMAPKASE